jgi:hypothetical protein
MSKYFSIDRGCLWILALVAACNGDDVQQAERKGIVDEEALEAGVVVTLRGDLGEVEVPFAVPVPASADTTDAETAQQVAGAVSLVVANRNSGVTADLADGTLVEETPTAAGQWSFVLNEERDLATLTFFNESPLGDALRTSGEYDAYLSIAENDYVEAVPSIGYAVSVVGG